MPSSQALARHVSVLAIVVASIAMAGCGDSTTDPVTTEAAVRPAGPCPPEDAAGDAEIDMVPFVVVDGVMFHATFTPEVSVPESVLGEVVATVQCRIAGTVGDPGFRAREGDAAYLPAGTKLRAVEGYRTDFRLAAWEEGAWRIYEISEPADAEIGEDLLDIRGKVEAIHLVEGERGEGILRSVEDPDTVERVVEAVLEAPVLADETRFDRMGNEAPLFVRFDLSDGTAVQRAWHVDSGVLAGQLDAPTALTEALQPGR